MLELNFWFNTARQEPTGFKPTFLNFRSKLEVPSLIHPTQFSEPDAIAIIPEADTAFIKLQL